MSLMSPSVTTAALLSPLFSCGTAELGALGSMTHPATLLDLLTLADARGDRPALVHRTGFRRVTFPYQECARQARRIAGRLREEGLTPGKTVLLWGPNGPGWVWSFFGILAAGGVVVPADLHAPTDAVRRIAERARVSFVVATRLKPQLGLPVPTIDLEELFLGYLHTSSSRQSRVLHASSPDDVAELLFTSGTEGNSKGVTLTHANILKNMEALLRVIRVRPDWTFLSVLPLSHVFEQVVGFLIPWHAGSRLVYLDTVKPSELAAAFVAEQPTHMLVVPRLLQLFRRQVLQHASASHLQGALRALLRSSRNLPTRVRRALFRVVHRRFGGKLAVFFVGGASLPEDLEAFWRTLGVTIVQGYGLTETSPLLTVNTLEEQRPGSVGRSLPGQELRVAEDGEVLARGPHVFQGYVEDPAATAAAFTTDGWFRTGDLGRLEGGWLTLTGRKKDVIRPTHGLPVYPEDIEVVLSRLPGVQEAAVVGVPAATGEEVHAVILREPGASVSPEEIRSAANQSLESAQHIRAVTVWPGEDFPRTPTMKVQKYEVRAWLLARRRADARSPRILVEDQQTLSVDDAESAVPSTGVSRRLRTLIASATGAALDSVTSTRRLADDLGLDSIGRLELVSRLEAELHVDIEEGDLTATTTVADLARLIGQDAMRRRPFHWQWPLSSALVPLRRVLQTCYFFLFRRGVVVSVEGEEFLQSLRGPVLFVANHVGHGDVPVILSVLPPARRARTVVLIRAEAHERAEGLARLRRLLRFAAGSLLAVPALLPRTRGFRAAVTQVGQFVDRGGSLILFPEREPGTEERLSPLAPGAALVAQALQLPIVPMVLSGTSGLFAPGKYLRRWRKPRPVFVRIGQPFFSPPGPRADVLEALQRAFAGLRTGR